ncbi:MAG: hypothetical protein HYV96_13345 [Opitutae bacterium]|nr:hypothetical protein [Opitutae bacterium]
MRDFVLAALIHLAVPATGVGAYFYLLRTMARRRISPEIWLPFLVIFAVYGAALVLLLTMLFWLWSGMASIGAAVLVFLAPLVMLAQTLVLWPKRQQSHFHATAFWLSFAYTPSIVVVWLVARYAAT